MPEEIIRHFLSDVTIGFSIVKGIGYNRNYEKNGVPFHVWEYKLIQISFVTLEIIFALIWCLWRLLVLRKKEKIAWKQEGKLLLMYVNLAVILRFVFFPRARINGHVQPLIFDVSRLYPLRINLIPYKNLFVYLNLRDTLWNVAGNVLLFVPTGILLPLVCSRHKKWYQVIFHGALISLTIEILQLPFYDRATDIDDLILNTAGVILGYLIYTVIKIFRQRKENKGEVMKKAVTYLLVLLVLPLTLCGCAPKEKDKDVVIYDDMEKSFETSGLLSTNIGIFTKTVTEDSLSYGECGSGVIFKKEGNTYYALTAKHVVSHTDSEIIIFTINTELKTETIPGVEDFTILTEDSYAAMLPAKVEYTADADDLAVISFTSEEDLNVAELSQTEPKVKDRILCVGHPEMNWFARSYGEVTSGIQRFGESTGFASNAMEHSAYIQVGSSGGGVFNEEMKIAGIITGAMLTPDGSKFISGYMIPASEINACLEKWK